jgi:hypothetical protein
MNTEYNFGTHRRGGTDAEKTVLVSLGARPASAVQNPQPEDLL